MYTYPRLPRLPYPARVLSDEGASRGKLKWDRAKAWLGRGDPNRSDAAPAAVPCKRRLGRPWVSVRAYYGALPLAWLDGDRCAARNRRAQGPLGVCHVPGRTDQGFKTPRWSAERRCRVPLSPGDPGDKPRLLPRCAFRRSASPQKGEEKLKAQLALLRGNANVRDEQGLAR